MNAILFLSAFAMTAIAFGLAVMPLRDRTMSSFPKIVLPAVIALMLFAIGLYTGTGRPVAANGETPLQTGAQATGKHTGKQKLASVNQMLAGLEERLRQQPDDGKGWLLLARSYDYVGRRQDSIDAFARARELGADDSGLAARIGVDSRAVRYPIDIDDFEYVSTLVN